MSCLRLLPKKRFSRLIFHFFVIAVIFMVAIKIVSHERGQFSTVDPSVEVLGVSEGSSVEISFERQVELDHADTVNMENAALSKVGNLPDPDFILPEDKGRKRNKKLSNKCGNFPDLYRLEFSNLHWQVQKIGNLIFYLYRAYYDDRSSKSIRILTMVQEPIKIRIPTVCQLWYTLNDKKKFVSSPVTSQIPIWYWKWTKKGKYTAYLLTCPIPQDEDDDDESFTNVGNQIPISVSLVGHDCDNATNNLGIVNNVPEEDETRLEEKDKKTKIRFGVCVKGLDFLHNDQSLRLIEWIELLLIMGVEKIFFYELSIHPNVRAVLEYYQKLGKIELTPLTLPGTLPNEPGLRHLFLTSSVHHNNKRKNEVIPYNDCLFKNLGKFDYLSVLDTDEIIIPKNGYTWEDLITEINESLEMNNTTMTNNKPIITSYCFRNIYFFDSIPEGEELATDQKIPSHLHMLKHVYRSSNYTPPGKFIKCIHSTAKTLLVHNHFPLKCIDGPCHIHHTDYRIGHMQHYRSTCVRDLKNCDDYENSLVQDSTIWKYKDELINRVNKTISQLRLL